MQKKTIRTVINFCTNDYRYLKLCIEAVAPFSEEVIVPVCDHFFNGEKENRYLLNEAYKNNPKCRFIEYRFPEEKPYGSNPPITTKDVNYKHYMHSTSRYLGFTKSIKTTDYTLFIDVDEIVDTERFINWWNKVDDFSFNALRFYSYFYFRESQYRCKSYFSVNGILVKNSVIENPEIILAIGERLGLYLQIQQEPIPYILGLDHKPLFHHYSWVRTKEELEKKVTTWGHAHESDWLDRIQEEYSSSFCMMDYVFYHRYEKVDPIHNPMEVPIPKEMEEGSHTKLNFDNVSYI